MRQRVYEPTGKYLAEIGFGGIPIINEPFDKAVEVVDYAISRGFEYIDTARAYKDSENKIGEVMKTRRGEVMLATKTTARDYDGAMRDLQESLEALNTDFLDVWQLHDISTQERYDKVMAPEGAMKAFLKMQEQGVVKLLGITGHNNKLLVEALKTGYFQSVLAVYNLGVHDSEEELIPEAKRRGVAVIVMKPLSGGVFFTRPKNNVDPMHAWWFVLENKDINVALAGCKNKRDVDQAVKASETFRPLSEEERKKALELANFLGEDVCRNCGYCRDCPVGIPIPEIMQMFDEARQFSYEWPRFLKTYSSLEHKADECIDCGQCEEACPFDLPIRERIREFHKRWEWMKDFGAN